MEISYRNEIFKARLTREKAFPNDFFKVEFENSELLKIIESPIWIEEKGDVYSFKYIDYDSYEQIALLNSIAVAIDEYYFLEC